MRAVLKTLFTLIWLPLMMGITTLPWLLKWEGGRRFMTRLTFKGMNLVLGLSVQIDGSLSNHRPLLLVSNHSSYLDIFVLARNLPVAFTPKAEIRSWPVIGYCCKLAGCVFVERTPKAIAHTKEQIASRLAMGRVMCIFAEGTTNDGTHLKPFKSSFFSLAEGEAVRIQPALVEYISRDGKPLDAEGRAELAWYDDMSLLPHLWQVLKARRITARITLLPLLPPGQDRKALCAASERVIKDRLEKIR